VPLHRSRSQRFDELILEAVARLETRWEAQLSGVEFAVEEIPPPDPPGLGPESVSLARLDPGSPGTGSAGTADRAVARPPRIVVYRRPRAARADSEEELGELRRYDLLVRRGLEALPGGRPGRGESAPVSAPRRQLPFPAHPAPLAASGTWIDGRAGR